MTHPSATKKSPLDATATSVGLQKCVSSLPGTSFSPRVRPGLFESFGILITWNNQFYVSIYLFILHRNQIYPLTLGKKVFFLLKAKLMSTIFENTDIFLIKNKILMLKWYMKCIDG